MACHILEMLQDFEDEDAGGIADPRNWTLINLSTIFITAFNTELILIQYIGDTSESFSI